MPPLRRVSAEGRATLMILALLSPGLLGGCSDRDVIYLPAGEGSLSLVTFNAAIGVGLAPYAPERLDAIEQDLPGLGADVICLQELWQPEDLERIARALLGEYPYAHRSVKSAGGIGQAACTESESSLLESCLEANCAGVAAAGLPLCAIANCAMAFTEVATPCQQCVVANQAAPDVNELVRICGENDGEAAAYENQTGLLLLSKLPLEQPDFLKLESTLGDRGVLSARVPSALGALDVYCTHLAASLSQVPYTGPYGSWQGERVEQIERFLDWVAERSDGGAAALLGDMNCGPETALARSASPDAFERFVAAGFRDPYAESDGRCTFCGNNPLNVSDPGFVTDSEEGAVIDHVLLLSSSPKRRPGWGELASAATRVLDDVIEIRADGSDVETAHSDHYGVSVTVSSAGSEP